MITIYGGKQVFSSSQTILLYQGVYAPLYPVILGLLAPNTSGELYKTGSLLAKYGANAPTPNLQGAFVNYDPTSSNADQAICVGAVSGQFVGGVVGTDVTNIDTATETYNRVNVALFNIGMQLYENALSLNNTTAQMTGFNNTYKVNVLDTCLANGGQTNVITIQGVN